MQHRKKNGWPLGLMAAALLWVVVPAGAVASEPAASPMSAGQAAALGVVEGLTEYLPVSSTGHLILTQRAMGIANSAGANAYAVCIQLGAIVAVLGLYAGRIRQIFYGLLGRDAEGRRLLVNLLTAFVPAAVLGLLLDHWIEQRLFGLWPIVAAWGAGGLAILTVHWAGKERFPPEGRDILRLLPRQALLIGLLQCLAMWPGVSRSLVTIVGGVLVGLSLPAAVEFSFLLGAVTLSAATGYKAVQLGSVMVADYGAAALAIGFVMALAAAVLAVKWMVAYLNRHGLALFGYYRVALAAVTAILILAGVLHP